MASTLFVLGPDELACETVAEVCRRRGWDVAVSALGTPGIEDSVAAAAPAACVVCLDDVSADQVTRIADRLSAPDNPSRPLLMFAGGSVEDVETIRAVAPYAMFVRPDEVDWMLKHLVAKT